MKKWFVIVLSFFFIWVGFKYFGIIGRQFHNGMNVSEKFAVTSVDDTFELQLQPSKRGIYRYNASLVFNGENSLPIGYNQNIEVAFTEIYCNSQKVLGTGKALIQSKPGSSFHQGLGRYGKLIKPAIFKRSEPICLIAKIENLSQPLYSNLELSIWVGNQRPCWGLECMLD